LALIFWALFALRHATSPSTEEVPLQRPFSELPLDLLGKGWTGTHRRLEEAVETTAGVSDYVNRHYEKGNQHAWFYVGYVSPYRAESIHYPEICFPSGGRQMEEREDVSVTIGGTDRDAVFRENVWSTPTGKTYTLSAVYYDGGFDPEPENLRLVPLEKLWQFDFGGLRYFAIVILSGELTGSRETTRRSYTDMLGRALPVLLRHLPAGED